MLDEEWTVEQAVLPSGQAGRVEWARRAVVVDRRLSQVQRRCTVAHELVHVERGPVPTDPWLRLREERAVEAEAARRLITLDALADALAWSDRPVEVADELWVDEQLLDARVAGLSEGERAWLTERLGAE